MKTRTKMMLMNTKRHEDQRMNYDPRYTYEEGMRMGYAPHMGYDMRSERSGSRGYTQDGMTYPIYPSSGYEGMEGRFRDRRGREHSEDGRFVSPRNRYPIYPFVPPIYEREDRGRNGGGEMNRIGFNYPMEANGDYGDQIENPSMHDMKHRPEKAMRGHASSKMMSMPMAYETAMEWMDELENADGSRGAHWTMAQTKEVQEKKGIHLDPVEFFAAMNMMYSDYCKIAKRYNVNTPDFYAGMAKAFLEDKDAVPDKLAKYYECIVEH